MSAEPAGQRHLRPVEDEAPAPLIVVNTATGQQLGTLDDHAQHFKDQIDGLERDIRGWRTRFANLKRDKDVEAREHELWPEAIKLFALWKKECKHGRSAFTQDRFWLALPFLGPQPEALLAAARRLGLDEAAEPYGPVICKLAIEGAAYDPYVTTRRNGSKQRHDGWDLIFRGAAKVEEFACRAPKKVDGAQALPVDSTP